MRLYAQALYDAWCANKSEQEIIDKYQTFITYAAIRLYRTYAEMEEFLLTQDWFKFDKNSKQ